MYPNKTTIKNNGNSFDIPIPFEPQFESDILFAGNKKEDQYWRKIPIPREFSSKSAEVEYWEKEFDYCFISGRWMVNKGELVWLPPKYYSLLQHWRIRGKKMGVEFRLKRLRHALFRHMIKCTPSYIGSFTIKNRRDGETISAMSDMVNEALISDAGIFGIQSKTGDDARDVCWSHLMYGFRGLHPRFKMHPDGSPIWQGTTDPKKQLIFAPQSKIITGRTTVFDLYDEEDQFVQIYYRPTVSNAFDGREMAEIVLDEFCKWEEDSPFQAYQTYIDCVLQGKDRRGLFNIFSSPAEKNTKANAESFELWKMSDPNEIDPETGVTKSRLLQWFSDPLEGIESFYDKYGGANSDEIHAYLMNRRKNLPEDKVLSEIRRYPLNIREAFQSYENTAAWTNKKAMEKRMVYLQSTFQKDNQEPKSLVCALSWKDGIPDTTPILQIAGPGTEPTETHRFVFARTPNQPGSVINNPTKKPPKIIQSVIGIDPYDYRRPRGQKKSNGGGTQYRFLEFDGPKGFDSFYLGRPRPEIMYEDMILWAVYTSSLAQVEAKNQGVIDHFEDRGYFGWLLPSDLDGDSDIKGNSPSGNSRFLDEMISIFDGLVTEEFLEDHWLELILSDSLLFDRDNTHPYDLTMSALQSVFGAYKIIKKGNRRKPPSEDFIREIRRYL